MQGQEPGISIFCSKLRLGELPCEGVKISLIDPFTTGTATGVGADEYFKALKGKPNSRFTYSGSVLSDTGITTEVSCVLKTFIPFRQVRKESEGGGELIMGVIEIEKDLLWTKDFPML